MRLRLWHLARTIARSNKLQNKMHLWYASQWISDLVQPVTAPLSISSPVCSSRHRPAAKRQPRGSRGAAEVQQMLAWWCMNQKIVWRILAGICRHFNSSYSRMFLRYAVCVETRRGVQQPLSVGPPTDCRFFFSAGLAMCLSDQLVLREGRDTCSRPDTGEECFKLTLNSRR